MGRIFRPEIFRMVPFLIMMPALLLGGCGGGSGAGEKEVSAVNGALVSITPANGATKVSVLTGVRVTLSGNLDLSTINPTTVRLTNNGTPVAGAVTYDALTRTVAFAPARNLSHGEKYLFTVSGIKDASGNPTPVIVSTFRTLANAVSREIHYSGGNVSYYFVNTFDANGDIARAVHYYNAGRDGVWFTPDDLTGYRYRCERDANGDLQRRIVYRNPGGDGKWFTADDGVAGYTQYAYDMTGRMTGYVDFDGPGADGVWFTADDAVRDFYTYSYDQSGYLVQYTKYSDAGPDHIRNTADDTVAYYYRYYLNEFGNRTRLVKFTGPGTDGVWFTDDDVVGSYAAYTHFGSSLSRVVTYNDPGADLKWFTGDDKIGSYEDYHYDTSGNQTYYINYGGPGSDGVWFTADDVVVQENKHSLAR